MLDSIACGLANSVIGCVYFLAFIGVNTGRRLYTKAAPR